MFLPFSTIVSPDSVSILSAADDSVIPFPDPPYPWNVICHPLVNIFIPVPVSAIPSHFIAPDTFIAAEDPSESPITSVLYVAAPFTRRNQFEFVFHLLTHDESYDSIIDHDITTLCPDVPVCIIPPVIVRSVPS